MARALLSGSPSSCLGCACPPLTVHALPLTRTFPCFLSLLLTRELPMLRTAIAGSILCQQTSRQHLQELYKLQQLLSMTKGRLEAFSDGVIAIIITIMVLEMKVPHGADLESLRPLIPVFLSYILSFIFIGIYWSNHHHLIQAVKHVNGRILWANLHLLFWLSLVPFVTGWMGENHFAALPVSLYGVVLLGAAIAYFILTRSLIVHHGKESELATAVGTDFKGKISPIFYILAIPLAFVHPLIAAGFYTLVAVMWLIPDRRIEKTLMQE